VNIGSINYDFTNASLEPGHTAGAISVPHPAVRIILFGHQFNPYLSAQISYMRPVNWVEYRDVTPDNSKHTVWMNIAGLTLVTHVPLNKKFSVSAEAGLGIITRKGFKINEVEVMKNAVYSTLLSGASVQYHVNRKWDLQFSTVLSPQNKSVKQPKTTFFAVGFNYHMRELPKERIGAVQKANHKFPHQIFTVGYTTNALGYGVNDFASKGAIPFFWGGGVQIKRGFSLSYQRNIFHTKKVFALDWAAHVASWQTRKLGQHFFTASLNPVFRFTAVRTKPVDIFLEYSVAGPTYISKDFLDEHQTGRNFTFHDFMGMGFFVGKDRTMLLGMRIAHYSNGNIYPENDGLKIPLTFNLGYSF
jgi:hypothetical protein